MMSSNILKINQIALPINVFYLCFESSVTTFGLSSLTCGGTNRFMTIFDILFDELLDGDTERFRLSEGTPSNAVKADGSFWLFSASAASGMDNIAFSTKLTLIVSSASSSSDSEAYPDKSARPDISIANWRRVCSNHSFQNRCIFDLTKAREVTIKILEIQKCNSTEIDSK
jgi:hypothetical protein